MLRLESLLALALTGDTGDFAHTVNDALGEWAGGTGAASHMTDSLDCMGDVELCRTSVKGIAEEVCVAEAVGTLTVVFVDGDQEFIACVRGVMYVLKMGYILQSPNAAFDGEYGTALIILTAR